MTPPRQQVLAAIRAEVKRHEGAKKHVNKLIRLVETVPDPRLRANLTASLCVVQGTGSAGGSGGEWDGGRGVERGMEGRGGGTDGQKDGWTVGKLQH